MANPDTKMWAVATAVSFGPRHEVELTIKTQLGLVPPDLIPLLDGVMAEIGARPRYAYWAEPWAGEEKCGLRPEPRTADMADMVHRIKWADLRVPQKAIGYTDFTPTAGRVTAPDGTVFYSHGDQSGFEAIDEAAPDATFEHWPDPIFDRHVRASVNQVSFWQMARGALAAMRVGIGAAALALGVIYAMWSGL